MMVREAPPTWSDGVVGTQNWVQLDSIIAIAFNSSQGKRAGTEWLASGLPQPWPMFATLGPALPHTEGPPATSWKMGCHWAVVGLVPGTASTPQL